MQNEEKRKLEFQRILEEQQKEKLREEGEKQRNIQENKKALQDKRIQEEFKKQLDDMYNQQREKLLIKQRNLAKKEEKMKILLENKMHERLQNSKEKSNSKILWPGSRNIKYLRHQGQKIFVTCDE